MQPTPLDVMIALIPLLVITGLLVLAALWMYRMSKLRELKQRQVLAMIEKGITPPPELHPVAFNGNASGPRLSVKEGRFKSGGIMLVGLGAAVGLVIAVAGGQVRVGLGVGGAIAVLGIAMVVSALVSRDTDPLVLAPPAQEAREGALSPPDRPAGGAATPDGSPDRPF